MFFYAAHWDQAVQIAINQHWRCALLDILMPVLSDSFFYGFWPYLRYCFLCVNVMTISFLFWLWDCV